MCMKERSCTQQLLQHMVIEVIEVIQRKN